MERGRLDAPNLDDRTWRDIVDQSRALLSAYLPAWNDDNPSDLGMTLVEMFAWIVEGMIYRLNRVPERSHVQFLDLLGVKLAPSRPATTWMTFQVAPGSPPVVLPRRSRFTTVQTESAPPAVFETDDDVVLRPANLQTALLLQGPSARDVTAELVGPPLAGLAVELGPGATATIALRFDAALATVDLHVLVPPGSGSGALTAQWRYSDGTADPDQWPAVVAVEDRTNGLSRSGSVRLSLPSAWAAQPSTGWTPPEGEELEGFWLALSVQPSDPTSVRRGIGHILHNAMSAANVRSVTEHELLGVSTGEPFQRFLLRHRPLAEEPQALDPWPITLEVRARQADGAWGPWVRWARVDDLPAGPAPVFRLDRIEGSVLFGDHDGVASTDGHGAIPPTGSEVRATGYRYVAGGASANVAAGTVTMPDPGAPGLVAALNPGAATGGRDEETTDAALVHAAEALRTTGRAVTPADYERLVLDAIPGVAKVRCLGPRLFDEYDTTASPSDVGQPWTFASLDRSPGTVTVIIVPGVTAAEVAAGSARPQPSIELQDAVRRHLDGRRTLTGRLHVAGPRYLPIRVTVALRVWRRAQQTLGVTPAGEAAKALLKVREFLHPVLGGRDGRGWEVGQGFVISELLEHLQLAPEVGFVETLVAQAPAPDYSPPVRPLASSVAGSWVQLADYELVCSATDHDVTALEA